MKLNIQMLCKHLRPNMLSRTVKVWFLHIINFIERNNYTCIFYNVLYNYYFKAWTCITLKPAPVFILSGCSDIQSGILSPSIKENPRIVRFRMDDKSMNCRTEIPTAATIPNNTVSVPPIMGVGINVRIAPNFPMIPPINRIMPHIWKTRLLATCKGNWYRVVDKKKHKKLKWTKISGKFNVLM